MRCPAPRRHHADARGTPGLDRKEAPVLMETAAYLYPWALCPAQEAVHQYALGLAGDVAELPGITGVELESFGWYGFDHLSAHDKVGGVRLTGAEQYLFSLCFCDACDGAYRAAGIHPDELRGRVRAALDPVFAGAGPVAQPADAAQPEDEVAAIDALPGGA